MKKLIALCAALTLGFAVNANVPVAKAELTKTEKAKAVAKKVAVVAKNVAKKPATIATVLTAAELATVVAHYKMLTGDIELSKDANQDFFAGYKANAALNKFIKDYIVDAFSKDNNGKYKNAAIAKAVVGVSTTTVAAWIAQYFAVKAIANKLAK